MAKLKDIINRKIREKKFEKEQIKKQKEFDKEIEKEYKEKYVPKHENISNKMAKGMANFFDILWPDDEEQIDHELDELLTDKEKEERDKEIQEEKSIMRTAILIMVSAIFVGLSLITVYLHFNKSEYDKIIKPLIIDYFRIHYTQDVDIRSHEYICYKVEKEQGRKEDECTNILVSTLNNNAHVVTIDNKYLGDDLSQNSHRESFKTSFEKRFSYITIIYQNPMLSYKDFYHDYYPYEYYSNILPVSNNYSELESSKKLTINNTVLYQGDLNIGDIQSYLSNYSEDSSLYLIKETNGYPSNLTVVKNNYLFQANITASKDIHQNITYYEIDRNLNYTNSITVKEVSSHGITSYSNHKDNKKYVYTNGIFLDVEQDRKGFRDEPPKENYFLVKFKNNSYLPNYSLINGSAGNYRETEKNEYPLFETLTIGENTYIIGDKSLGFGLKTEKKNGFICNFVNCD